MADIAPFFVMDLLARARELEAGGRSIIHMEVGEPDYPTPKPIVEAGKRALEQGLTHYTPAVGLPQLREAIAGHYRVHYGIEVGPERIVVTPGASGALQLMLSVLVEPGDEVLVSDPGYPCNRNFVRLVEGRAVDVPVGPESGYQMTPELIARYGSTRTCCVMLATPSNPTGTLLSPGEMERLHGASGELGARLLVDEIYHGISYGPAPPSALEIADDLFVINSFSKYFGMTGWRLGWLVAPTEFVGDIDKLAQNIFLSAPTPAQHAALAAFKPETLECLEQRVETFRQRRDFLLPAVRELGFEVAAEPQGAFYLYADCSRFTRDSMAFCREILEKVGVAITPGRDFGRNGADTHLRFAYTTSMEKLQEGVERLRGYLGG